MNKYFQISAFLFLTMISSGAVRAQTVVADLTKDFHGAGTESNWSYLWNQNDTIGRPSGYVELKPANIFAKIGGILSYSPDGTSDLPSKKIKDANDCYLRSDSSGKYIVGDCGLGPQQGARDERYTIIAYKIPKDGEYAIANSNLTSLVDTKRGNGFDYKVYVNEKLIKGGEVQPMGAAEFNVSLGLLSSGDIIYVAVGPGVAADCTNFSIQYQIANSE